LITSFIFILFYHFLHSLLDGLVMSVRWTFYLQEKQWGPRWCCWCTLFFGSCTWWWFQYFYIIKRLNWQLRVEVVSDPLDDVENDLYEVGSDAHKLNGHQVYSTLLIIYIVFAVVWIKIVVL